jgi:hypothetical protein
VSDKATCPGCDAYTSPVFQAFAADQPCPYCELPADVANAVRAARERHEDSELADRALAAEKRSIVAERRAREAAEALRTVHRAAAAVLNAWNAEEVE